MSSYCKQCIYLTKLPAPTTDMFYMDHANRPWLIFRPTEYMLLHLVCLICGCWKAGSMTWMTTWYYHNPVLHSKKYLFYFLSWVKFHLCLIQSLECFCSLPSDHRRVFIFIRSHRIEDFHTSQTGWKCPSIISLQVNQWICTLYRFVSYKQLQNWT
jgi:hypothetical protein